MQDVRQRPEDGVDAGGTYRVEESCGPIPATAGGRLEPDDGVAESAECVGELRGINRFEDQPLASIRVPTI